MTGAIPRDTIVDTLAGRLRDDVLSGRYPPGAYLPPERDLASGYGVTRTSLKHAIVRLVQAGLLETKHGVGTRVRDYERLGGPELLPMLVSRGGAGVDGRDLPGTARGRRAHRRRGRPRSPPLSTASGCAPSRRSWDRGVRRGRRAARRVRDPPGDRRRVRQPGVRVHGQRAAERLPGGPRRVPARVRGSGGGGGAASAPSSTRSARAMPRRAHAPPPARTSPRRRKSCSGLGGRVTG